MAETPANTPPAEKRSRILHLRVPESVEEALRSRAEKLGLPVSALARALLLGAMGRLDEWLGEGAGGGSENGEVEGPSRIRGWQQAILTMNAVCDRCNVILPRGSEAAVAMADGSDEHTVICEDCLDDLVETIG